MKQRFLQLSLALAALFALAAPLGASPVSAQVDSQTALCEGLGTKDCRDPAGSKSLSSVVASVINLLSVVVGIAAVIMIIFAGLRYITSGGDATKVSSAKDTILYAVIGLIIVALSQVIVRFVLQRVV